MKEIENIIHRYQNTDWNKEKVALGTVVRVEESAYRRIGARMYVSDNGEWIGGISGGCLEGDALKQAKMAISKNESSVVVYDTMDDDAHQIGIGLGCNGRIDVMFTPIDPNDKNNGIEQLIQIKDSRHPSVLVQVISANEDHASIRGKLYKEQYINQLSLDSGIQLEKLQEVLETVRTNRKSKVIDLQSDKGVDYEILYEFIRPKIKLVCIGDNYDVNALVSIGYELGWEIHVAGKMRKLSKHVFKHAKTVSTFEEVRKLKIDDYTAIILMSHDYKTDFELMKYFLEVDVPYLGLLGPRKRMQKMEDELSILYPGIDLSSRVNLFSPIGLDIGAESPEEIALSIAAEIISVQRSRSGQSLRIRQGPIHEREI